MDIPTSSQPALLLIDIQKGFDNIEYWGGQRNNPDAELRANELLSVWRAIDLPVFHIQHCSTIITSLLHPSNKGNAFKDMVKPKGKEVVIQKNVNSAFIGTDLKQQLDHLKVTTLVIVGLTTDHCISTSTRMAGNFGYNTFLISDATATFNKKGLNGQNYSAELMHETALASLNGEFANIVTTKTMLELMTKNNHQR
jgi:nicotinamidase-related amidase